MAPFVDCRRPKQNPGPPRGIVKGTGVTCGAEDPTRKAQLSPIVAVSGPENGGQSDFVIWRSEFAIVL